MNKQYTFSLPESIGQIIDALPKTKKSQYIAEAIINQEKLKAQQKALDVIDLLKPTDWDTDKDAVELVREARVKRTGQILSDEN